MASTVAGNFTDCTLTATDDGGHSETLTLHNGDFELSDLVHEGREIERYQSAGHVTGLRLGARVIPKFSFSGQLADPDSAFNLLLLGKTSGFVSTMAAKGDAPTVDLAFYFSFGANVRYLTLADFQCTTSMSAGSPNKVSWSGEVNGAVVNNGTTIISGL